MSTHETLPSGGGSGVSEGPLSTQLVSILDQCFGFDHVKLEYPQEFDEAIQQIQALIREAEKKAISRWVLDNQIPAQYIKYVPEAWVKEELTE